MECFSIMFSMSEALFYIYLYIFSLSVSLHQRGRYLDTYSCLSVGLGYNTASYLDVPSLKKWQAN